MTTYAHNLNAYRSLRLPWTFLALFFLFILSSLAGTGLVYSTLLIVFIVLTLLAIRTLGGMASLFGFTVLYFAFHHVFTAEITKFIVWQPLDSNLLQPNPTMGAYVLCMFGILVAAHLFKHSAYFKRKPLLTPVTSPRELMLITIVAIALDASRILIIALGGNSSVQGGTHETLGMMVLKSLDVLNVFTVVVATAYVVTSSAGKRMLSLMNGIPLAFTFANGLVTSYRGAMGLPVVEMLLAAFFFGYRFKRRDYILILVMLVLFEGVLFPFSYYTRGAIRFEPSVEKKAEITMKLFVDFMQNREKYTEIGMSAAEKANRRQHRWKERLYYFGDAKVPDFVDRFSTMILTDEIVNATINKGTVGLKFFPKGLLLGLPRLLAPDKPVSPVWPGNQLAHRVTSPRIVGKKDFVTGISCGFVADAFSCFSYAGVFLFSLVIFLTCFVLYSVVMGSSFKSNVFTVTYIILLANALSELVVVSILVDTFEGNILGFVALALIVALSKFMAANSKLLQLRPRTVS